MNMFDRIDSLLVVVGLLTAMECDGLGALANAAAKY